MLKNGEYFVIKEMKQKGMSIAEELGRDRKTISKWLKSGPPEKYTRKVTKPGKFDPFKDYIRKKWKKVV